MLGALLLYTTGSWKHNVMMRRNAVEKGLKLNQYGLFKLWTEVDEFGFDKQKEAFVAGKTEQDIFKALDMEFVEPEDREL